VAGTGGVDLRANITGNLTGNVSGSTGSVTGGVTVTTNNDKTGYSLTQTFPSNFASLSITPTGHISNVDILTTYTGNTPQTGDSFALIGPNGSGLTQVGLSSGSLNGILRTALTENYSANGAAPTLEQAIFGILSFLFESSVAGTAIQSHKLDHSTPSLGFTLNDATNPSSITRSS
jgi:hypothetical protein